MAYPHYRSYHALLGDKYIILLDQALLSVINFGSILLLSKIASISTFGDFVVTYSYSYFIFIFSTYLLSAPILVFLSKRWSSFEGKYLIVCGVINILINGVFSVILFYFLQKQVTTISLFFFLMLSLSMSSFDILKKFIFSSKNISVRFGLYATIILNLLFFGLLIGYKEALTLNTILSVYALSFSIGVTLLMIFLIRKNIFHFSSSNFYLPKAMFFRNVIQTHFHYSKWIILGGIAFWGYTQGIYILAKYYLIDDLIIGKVRTIQNLLGVFSIVLIALENHYTPIFSEKSIGGGIQNLESLIRKIFKENYLKFIALFILAIPIGLFFYDYVYSNKYGSGVNIFLMFLLVQFLLLVIRPFGIALKSIENTVPFFISHLLAGAVMFIAVPFLLFMGSNYTLALAITIANVVYVTYIGVHYLKKRNI